MASPTELSAVKGMNDVLPNVAESFLDSAVWERVLSTCAKVLNGYGYRQVWLPLVEDTALFARGIGTDTDIVAKEMYSFTDRAGRELTLRPEGTAGAVRAYIEHNLGRVEPVQRWWYAGPMFRAERPQKGRYRQFYQVGAELFGVSSAAADAELLYLLRRLCAQLGLDGVTVRLNTLGDAQTRAAYRQTLRDFLQPRSEALCENCRRRIEANPLRVLDCKRESCRAVVDAAPDILTVLSSASRAHFDALQEMLAGLDVPFVRDPRLVRGLDYYTGTTFEFTTTTLGAQDAVLGGGRYDELVQALGGPPTPAIGFAAGVERLALLVAATASNRAGPALYVIPMEGLHTEALKLAAALREVGTWCVEVDVSGSRVKQAMRRADKIGARAVLVFGEDEVKRGRAKIKVLGVSSGSAVEVEVGLSGSELHAALAKLYGTGE